MREGIRDAGGIAFEFPVHPIQETGKRPTAALDRNLAYLGLVEVLYGYPLDGVVLTTGCDKTTPACLMAAATVNIPAIVLSGGPMLNGWWKGERCGSGTVVWQAREELAAGEIDDKEFIDIVAASAPSVGHCNTMGTASTMNALAEALGMSLPGCAAIPAPYRERGQIAYETGRRAVEIVHEDLKPSDILTRDAFENAIVACSAIGGSTNAPIHINAIARHVGVKLTIEDWETDRLRRAAAGQHAAGGRISRRGILSRRRPAGGDERTARRPAGSTATRSPSTARPWPRTSRNAKVTNAEVIRPYDKPLKAAGRLQGAARQPVRFRDHEDQRDLRGVPQRYLNDPKDPNAFEGRAVVFDGPEDYHHRIDDPALDDRRTHASCSCAAPAPIGYPGSAEVVNMQPPAALIKRGITVAAMHRRRPAVRNVGLAVDPQRLARGGGRRRTRAAQDRRPRAHRSQQGHRRHPDLAGGAGVAARGVEEERRLSLPAEPDAVAGDPARHGRSARRRHGARTGGEIPARGAEIRAARQSLTGEPPNGQSSAFRRRQAPDISQAP